MANLMQSGPNPKTEVFHQLVRVADSKGWSFSPPSNPVSDGGVLIGRAGDRAVYLALSGISMLTQSISQERLLRDVELIASSASPENALLTLKLPEVDGLPVSGLAVRDNFGTQGTRPLPEIQGEVDPLALFPLRRYAYLPDTIESTVEVKAGVRRAYSDRSCQDLRLNIAPANRDDINDLQELVRNFLVVLDQNDDGKIFATAPSIIYLSDAVYALERARIRCTIDIDIDIDIDIPSEN